MMLTERFVRPGDLAGALEFSAAWSREARAAKAWAAYTGEQSALAWDFTLGMVENLRPALAAAMAKDQNLAKELSIFAKVMSFRSEVARKGAATKKRNKKQNKNDPPNGDQTPDKQDPAKTPTTPEK
jgi:hypothetical protein